MALRVRQSLKRLQRDVLDQSRIHRADPTVNEITSAFGVSKINAVALCALPYGAAVVREKTRCDGRIGGPIINIARQVLLITRLRIVIHNECADFLKALFVERNRLRVPAVKRCPSAIAWPCGQRLCAQRDFYEG